MADNYKSYPLPLRTGVQGEFKQHARPLVDNTVGRFLTKASDSSGTTVTLTTAKFAPGIALLTFSGQTAAVTATTPTAVAMAAAYTAYYNQAPRIGSSFDVLVRNNNTSSGTVTLAVGTGVTANPALTAQAIATVKTYRVEFTAVGVGAETADIYLQG